MKNNQYGNFLCAFCNGATQTKIIALTFKRRKQEFTFQNVKSEVCQKCGQAYYDGTSFLEVDNRQREELEKQILMNQEKVRQLKRQKAEEKRIEAQQQKVNKPRGRKKLSEEIIEKAKLMALTMTLPEVSFRLSIALKSLYNHGISRGKLNEEIKEQLDFSEKLPETT